MSLKAQNEVRKYKDSIIIHFEISVIFSLNSFLGNPTLKAITLKESYVAKLKLAKLFKILIPVILNYVGLNYFDFNFKTLSEF